MQSQGELYPLYIPTTPDQVKCLLHQGKLCNMVCTNSLCTKKGMICKECMKIDIHKVHWNDIHSFSKVVEYLKANLVVDNFVRTKLRIQDIQEKFAEVVDFLKEDFIPPFLNIESQIKYMKDSFWDNILLTSTVKLREDIENILKSNTEETEQITKILQCLGSYKIMIYRVFNTEMDWFFQNAMNLVLEEFQKSIRAYFEFIKACQKQIQQNREEGEAMANATLFKMRRVVKMIEYPHQFTPQRTLRTKIQDLNDGKTLAYFNENFVYFYNYETDKTMSTIETDTIIGGILNIEKSNLFITYHHGQHFQSYGISIWDKLTKQKIQVLEGVQYVIGMKYISKQDILIYAVSPYPKLLILKFMKLKERKIVKSIRLEYEEDHKIEDVQLEFLDKTNLLCLSTTSGSEHQFLFYSLTKFRLVKIMTANFAFDYPNNERLDLKQEMQIIRFKGTSFYSVTPFNIREHPIQQLELKNDSMNSIQSFIQLKTPNLLLLSVEFLEIDYRGNGFALYDPLNDNIIAINFPIDQDDIVSIFSLDNDELIVACTCTNKILFLKKVV